uniref:TonB-dependent siderophore receptor n=1 Tax=Heterorhabditis bacteriophora TaxID=37862 RepID=A0A1I7WXK6_HETBA
MVSDRRAVASEKQDTNMVTGIKNRPAAGQGLVAQLIGDSNGSTGSYNMDK